MRTPEEREEAIEKQRAEWKDNFDRRWAQVEDCSAKAKRDFQNWLQGFRPGPYAASDDDSRSVLSDHVGKTGALWALAAVLLSVWALGLLTSITLGGGIHLAFTGAIVLMVVAWLRRIHHRKPITIKSRSGWGSR